MTKHKINNCRRFICYLTIFIFFLNCVGSIAFAEKNIYRTSSIAGRIEYINPLYIQISAKGINHLSLAPLIVTTITGDVSEYSAVISENGSEIFITSKLEAGKNIPIAVTVAGGKVIDLNLAVVNSMLPKAVKLDLHRTPSTKQVVRDEIIHMVDAMRMSAVGKYYVIENTKKAARKDIKIIDINGVSLSVSELNTYRFDDLLGIELDIKNIDIKEAVLSTDILNKTFKDVIAIAVNNKKLGRGQTTKAYIVLKYGYQV